MHAWLLLPVLLLSACSQAQTPHVYEQADTSKWLFKALDPDLSPVDLSFLNDAPAGKYGFVRARGNDLVFDRGRRAKFWGANVQAYSLFSPTKEKIDAHAKRLAQLGFNLVRLHHHDSATWVTPSLIADGVSSRGINPQALDNYFYWVSALKKNGIYVFVDLYTGRPFREGDEIPGFEELAKKNPKGVDARGYTHVNSRLQELIREFGAKLLTTENPYTKLALKDDPAVAGVLLTNENDVTFHFGNALLGDKGVPFHNSIFNRLVEEFAKAHNLKPEEVGKTWEAGPSKLFLNDLEYRFSKGWAEHLRRLGVKVPIISGHMWGTPLFSLPALTAGDATDAHNYEQGEWIDKDPRVQANLLHSIGMAQVEGKPMWVTEWNTEDSAKSQDPFTLPLYVAAIGSFQGWDAPMIYGYSQDGLGGGARDMWSSYTHPAVMGLMPAAALMFRRDVKPAKDTVVIRPTREQLFFEEITAGKSLSLRTLLETHRFSFSFPKTKELPWLQGNARSDAYDFGKDYLGAGVTEIVSDTGEIRRSWADGTQWFDTPGSQGVQGWIGGKSLSTRDARFQIDTKKASVVLTSLDGRGLRDSSKLLLTAVARVQPSEQGYFSEPVTGKIGVKSKFKGLKVTELLGDGKRGHNVVIGPVDGYLEFHLRADAKTHWYLLER